MTRGPFVFGIAIFKYNTGRPRRAVPWMLLSIEFGLSTLLAHFRPTPKSTLESTRSVTKDHSLTIAISTRRDSFFEDFGISGPKDEYSIFEVATPFEVMYSPTLNARSKPRW